ncbi:hypothetical protein DdX_13344 [Ditylenchus destructor]|uniref:Glycine zipper 2TM domain-containing protein n=1 Tax=Ditylenchus destructor TaxID=166010 RepID=A0AAD4MWR0_9BILA|nr:hypothetical protein DdX_13344 [Ditylenchus destructor]
MLPRKPFVVLLLILLSYSEHLKASTSSRTSIQGDDLRSIYESICGINGCPGIIERIIDFSARVLGDPWTRTLGKYASLPVFAILDTYRIGSVLFDDLKEGQGYENTWNVFSQTAGGWFGGIAASTIGAIIGTAIGGRIGSLIQGQPFVGAVIGGILGYAFGLFTTVGTIIGTVVGGQIGTEYRGNPLMGAAIGGLSGYVIGLALDDCWKLF